MSNTNPTNNNLSIWNELAQPPAYALRPIKAGRQAGKSDITPQWRYQAMTELFGPIGIGWKYTITRVWTEQGANNEIMCFATVDVYIKDPLTGEWSEPVPGIGGNTLIANESRGLYNNDEGFKMAVTDALSVALKMFGVAADVYMGSWDGSKYNDREDTPKKSEKKAELKPRGEKEAQAKNDNNDPIKAAIKAWKTKLVNKAKEKGYVADDIPGLLGDCLGKLNAAKDIKDIQDAGEACLKKVEAAPVKEVAKA